jgi:ribosomal-protein-alanine N-acetyltransferase
MKKQDILKLLPITADRLIIRVATLGDAQLIQDAKESRDANLLRRWMSWSSDEGMSMKGTIDYLARADSDSRTIALLAVDKLTGAHVLSTGLDAEDDEFNTISTGWWLSHGHEGKGLAYEGMSAVIDFCKVNRVCKTLTSDHYEGNERSQSLMQRLGFQYIKTQPKAHQCHLDGVMYDVLNYELKI